MRNGIWTLTALMVWAACLTPARADETYYQVTYSDGRVADQSTAPDTQQGIRGVLKITRTESPSGGYKVLSTDYAPLTVVGGGRTVKRDLAWNGRAWAEPAGAGGELETPQGVEAVLQDELKRSLGVLTALKARIKEQDHVVGQAQRRVDSAKGSAAEQQAVTDLRDALALRDRLIQAADLYGRQVEALSDAAHRKEFLRTTGEVRQATSAPADEKELGVTRPAQQSATVEHRTQVWKLPEGKGARNYEVKMAHPQAGPAGAFFYVAYGDSDGDGAPDHLIARSPLAEARQDGGWTSWTFSTDEPMVFVGNAWPSAQTPVYLQRADERANAYRGIENDVWISGALGGIPGWRCGDWPFFTNLRVTTYSPNPDAPPPTSRPVEIVD